MSDFSEVRHGYERLLGYFRNQEKRPRFLAALDSCFPNSGAETLKRFDDWWFHIQTSSYILCLSEHKAGLEDIYGRLSMWRAYGKQQASVAIVLKPPSEYSAIPLNVFLSPVAYFTDQELWDEFDSVIRGFGVSRNFLCSLPREMFVFLAYRMLVMATLSLKHPAFREELEWRLIHLPFEAPSPHVQSVIVTVGGVPQQVFKIRLEDKPQENISGITIPELFDRLIIGPTQYAGPIFTSLVDELGKAGVTDAASKVFISDIPLRT